MAVEEHLDILKQGVEVWNQWRSVNPAIKPDLSEAHLEGFDLSRAHFEGTNFSKAFLGVKENPIENVLPAMHIHIEQTKKSDGTEILAIDIDEFETEIADKSQSSKVIRPANLRGSFFDKLTNLEGVILGNKVSGFVSAADLDWGGVNLAVIDWTHISMLGDEFEARHCKQAHKFRTAVRANRQLAVALQSQGLNEEAAKFGYHAQLCKQRLLLLQLLSYLVRLFRWKWLARLMLHSPHNEAMHKLSSIIITISSVLLLLFYIFIDVLKLDIFSLNQFLKYLPAFGYFVLLAVFAFILTYKPLIRVSFVFLLILILIFVIIFYIFSLSKPSNGNGGPVWLAGVLAAVTAVIGNALVGVIARILQRSKRHGLPLLRQALVGYFQYVFSLFLNLLAGYGYRPEKGIYCYLAAILGFTWVYIVFGHLSPFPDAIIFSIASFHGRGFFPSLGDKTNPLTLHDPLVVFAALEAIVGLLIELSFIATFTQRYFGK